MLEIGIIDKIGYKEAQIKELTTEVEALRKLVKEEINVGEEIREREFFVKKTERATTTYSPAKVKKLINNDKKFIEVVTVSNTKVKTFLSMEQLDKCVDEVKISEVLTIKRID